MSLIETRGHQMFPVLDPAQIATARRFASGAARAFAPGEPVYDVGERHTPMWLVLAGEIEIVRRDGLKHETAITTLHASSAARSASSPDAARSPPGGPAPPAAPRCPSTPRTCARWWSARPRSAKR